MQGLGKTRHRGQTRVGAHILGQTIGNAIASSIDSQNDTATPQANAALNGGVAVQPGVSPDAGSHWDDETDAQALARELAPYGTVENASAPDAANTTIIDDATGKPVPVMPVSSPPATGSYYVYDQGSTTSGYLVDPVLDAIMSQPLGQWYDNGSACTIGPPPQQYMLSDGSVISGSPSDANRAQAQIDFSNNLGGALANVNSLAIQSPMIVRDILVIPSIVRGGLSQIFVTETAGGIRTAEDVVYNGITGPGPLGTNVANTFRSGTYLETVTSEDTLLYRVYGGKAGPLSQYWTRTAPSGPLQATIDSALLPEWGNTAQMVSTIRVPAGTTIYEGAAASQGGLVGGGSQVVIPRVNPGWLVTGH